LKENPILLTVLAILIIDILYFSNSWGRIFVGIFIFHILYQIFDINIKFPTIDIVYYGFAAWNISLIFRSFHKYFEKFENKNLVTKINLLLHIADILIFILTLAFLVKSFDIKNIELVTTGIGVALFVIVRKDLNNLKSFVIISWDNFISIGDKIVVDNKEGRILYINKFTSILQSENGNLIKIPNSNLIEENVTNKSKNKNHLKKEKEEK
jgi:small-conductance mechanosensitive channel